MSAIHLHLDQSQTGRLVLARAPVETIRTRNRTISPRIRSPRKPRSNTCVVVEITRDWVYLSCPDLVDLRLDEPLYRESRFVGIWLGIQCPPRISPVLAAGKEHQQQIR